MNGMELDYAVPAPDLAPYVTLFYRFRAEVPLFEDVERADHAQFRFRLSPGVATYRFATGPEYRAPAIHFLGATCSPTRTRAEGPVLVFGMGVTPLGWAAMLGLDASAGASRVIDAEAALGPCVRETADRLRAAADQGVDAMVREAEPLLRGLVAHGDDRTATFCEAVDKWLSGAPSPVLTELLDATGMTLRQAERRCKQLYGLAPKALARKYRALRAANAIAVRDVSTDQIVAEGFYDQSHLIRELKQFIGRTPGQIRADPGPLARLTIDQRRALHGRVAPIISDT
ncbi:helix-turn-helix domain-containing protein [Sphingomonas lenta]|uniref:AraC family transcriptional regulator n=1 Tax=Sphingomonas lenta TaxID=1141887 RepID=A0A2A2SEW5_9SPHN|nr:helix-turn-helix domain-containing protein [Sphingomonas lenta]PAX07796.1 AraC family transcriptional regulator [Sphingomonas lenta]